MSTLTETAEHEAEEAEAEDEDQENADQPEEETEAPAQPAEHPGEPAQPGLTEQEAEAEFKKLEKLAQNYLRRAVAIANRLGMPFQICPLDAFPGLAIPRQAHEVTSDVEIAVLGLIGKGGELEYEEYEGFKQCPTCKGKGDVKTGAVIERSKHTTCPNPLCGGKGYVTVALDSAPVNGAPAYPGAELQYTPLPQGIPDAWQRPAGHPHWGRDPREIGA